MNHMRIKLATIGAGVFLALCIVGVGRAQAPARPFELLEATIPELQAALAAGSVTWSRCTWLGSTLTTRRGRR
jgi:hypothetical protein